MKVFEGLEENLEAWKGVPASKGETMNYKKTENIISRGKLERLGKKVSFTLQIEENGCEVIPSLPVL